MKKTLLAVAIAASSLTTFAGSAAPTQSSFAPFYAGMNGGMSILRGELNSKINGKRRIKNGLNIGGFMGYRFNENMRADGSFDYMRHSTNINNSHLNLYLLMANAYYDITQINMSGITPYIGAGMGWLHTSPSNNNGQSSNHFAWQLATGVNYDFTSNMALGLGYRLVSSSINNQNSYFNLINASLTYKFAM